MMQNSEKQWKTVKNSGKSLDARRTRRTSCTIIGHFSIHKSINFQGEFSIISAFSIETSKTKLAFSLHLGIPGATCE